MSNFIELHTKDGCVIFIDFGHVKFFAPTKSYDPYQGSMIVFGEGKSKPVYVKETFCEIAEKLGIGEGV
jgi:hypothetical protein